MSLGCGSIKQLAVDYVMVNYTTLRREQTVVNDGVKIRLDSGSTVDWHALLFNAWDRQRIIDVSLPSTSK